MTIPDPNRTFIAPIVRIEIDHMKASILHHIHTNHEELNKRLDVACEQAIQSFDFDGEVTRTINAEISKAIKDYFSYGNGATALKQAVDELLSPKKVKP